MKRIQTLSALFSFPGFRARSRLQGIFGDPHARVVTLVRQENCRMLRLWDTASHLLRPPDAPGAGYRCGGLAYLFGV